MYVRGADYQRDEIREFTLRTMRAGLSADTSEEPSDFSHESSVKRDRGEARTKRTDLLD